MRLHTANTDKITVCVGGVNTTADKTKTALSCKCWQCEQAITELNLKIVHKSLHALTLLND